MIKTLTDPDRANAGGTATRGLPFSRLQWIVADLLAESERPAEARMGRDFLASAALEGRRS